MRCPGQAHQPHSLPQPALSVSCCSGLHPPPVVLKALASSHPLVPTAADTPCLSSHFFPSLPHIFFTVQPLPPSHCLNTRLSLPHTALTFLSSLTSLTFNLLPPCYSCFYITTLSVCLPSLPQIFVFHPYFTLLPAPSLCCPFLLLSNFLHSSATVCVPFPAFSMQSSTSFSSLLQITFHFLSLLQHTSSSGTLPSSRTSALACLCISLQHMLPSSVLTLVHLPLPHSHLTLCLSLLHTSLSASPTSLISLSLFLNQICCKSSLRQPLFSASAATSQHWWW